MQCWLWLFTSLLLLLTCPLRFLIFNLIIQFSLVLLTLVSFAVMLLTKTGRTLPHPCYLYTMNLLLKAFAYGYSGEYTITSYFSMFTRTLSRNCKLTPLMIGICWTCEWSDTETSGHSHARIGLTLSKNAYLSVVQHIISL